jgi:hypothetical protein
MGYLFIPNIPLVCVMDGIRGDQGQFLGLAPGTEYLRKTFDGNVRLRDVKRPALTVHRAASSETATKGVRSTSRMTLDAE